MKILVTGGAGFIGSTLVDSLVSKHDVWVLDNLSSESSSENYLNDDAYFVKGSLDEVHDLIRHGLIPKELDAIIHCAAQTDVRKSMLDPIFDAQTNILDSLKLLEAAKNTGVKKFVFLSTGGAIYSEEGKIPFSEEALEDPVCGYGVSKIAFEKYLTLFSQTWGFDSVILRLSNVYGERNKKGVIDIFNGLISDGKDITVNGGAQTRDYIHVSDVVSAIVTVLNNRESKGIYNVGTGVETSLIDLVGLFEAMYTDWGGKIIYNPPCEGEVLRNALKSIKLMSSCGWKAEVYLPDGLKKLKKY